jgi:hypothetical protein
MNLAQSCHESKKRTAQQKGCQRGKKKGHLTTPIILFAIHTLISREYCAIFPVRLKGIKGLGKKTPNML